MNFSVILTADRTKLAGIELGTAGTGAAPPSAEWQAFIETYLKKPLDAAGWARLDLSGITPFGRRVYDACVQIPFGETRSYSELATAMGTPSKARAVGTALGKNPFPLIIPCHRVLGKNGDLCGFAFGLDCKRALLEAEHAL